MLNLPKNVWILTACLSLFMSLSVFMVFVAGIIGSTLAPLKSLATLPVATIVVGTASVLFQPSGSCQFLVVRKFF